MSYQIFKMSVVHSLVGKCDYELEFSGVFLYLMGGGCEQTSAVLDNTAATQAQIIISLVLWQR